MTLLKALLVASMSFIAGEIYANLAWTYHWDYPPNWLGDYLLWADGESYYNMMDLSLHIYMQAFGFVAWGVLRWLGIPIEMGVVGVILCYLAAGNLWIALHAGTCTQGDASRLYGGVYSLLLFAAAFIFLWRAKHPVRVAIALLPILPLLGFATLFTVRFLVGYWWWNAAACDVLQRADSYFAGHDGREPLFTLLWTALTILTWSGVLAIGLRAGKQVTRTGV